MGWHAVSLIKRVIFRRHKTVFLFSCSFRLLSHPDVLLLRSSWTGETTQPPLTTPLKNHHVVKEGDSIKPPKSPRKLWSSVGLGVKLIFDCCCCCCCCFMHMDTLPPCCNCISSPWIAMLLRGRTPCISIMRHPEAWCGGNNGAWLKAPLGYIPLLHWFFF